MPRQSLTRQKLVAAIRSIHCAHSEAADQIRNEADYFDRNAARLRYPEFRQQRLFVGSGVIEAGMFRTVRGANAIIALRRCHLNGRFEDYREHRLASQLPLLCRAPGVH